MRLSEIRRCGWLHFRPTSSGECILKRLGEEHSARWELGERYTGRAAVHQGFYARIALDEVVDQFLGFHPHSMRLALTGAVGAALKAGFEIEVAGAHPNFIERGITSNSGWGEIDGERLHMMQPLVNRA